jgi:hypothetical protein
MNGCVPAEKSCPCLADFGGVRPSVSVKIAAMGWGKKGTVANMGLPHWNATCFFLPYIDGQIMRLIFSLLLAGSSSYAASASTIAQSRSQPAIVQSLSTGIYRSATVIFEGHRAKVRFNRGEQIALHLDNPVTTESEEIMGVDQNQNYWAVYVDNEAPEPGPPASFSGALAEDLLDLPRRDPKDLQALQGANAESREAFADAMPFFGGLRIRHECLPIREVHDAEQDDAGADRHDVRHTCHPRRYPQSIVLACLGSAAATPLPQQSPAEDPTSHHSSTTEAEKPERPTSLKLLVPNILHDQKPIWTFPRKVVEGKHWKPMFGITLATVGLVVSDPYSEPYFRNSSGFNTYKMGPLRGRNTTLVITLTPTTFYLTGLA